jgi:hypothetical protein
MITLAPDDAIITLASDDSILSQMITLAPDDNIASQMITSSDIYLLVTKTFKFYNS